MTDDKIFNIDLSWMYNLQLYDEISQDVFARYNKDKHSNELLSIQNFLGNITMEYIKNKKDALEEFKSVKNNVKTENVKNIVKKLERVIFGYHYDDDNEERKYQESIAARTKMRRQNKETDKKDAARTFAPPDPDDDDSDKFAEMYYTPYSSIIYDGKTDEETEQIVEVYDKEGYDGTGYNKGGGEVIKMDLMKMCMMKMGLIKMGLIKMGMMNMGLIKMGLMKMGATGGVNKDGFNKDGKKI